MTAGIGNLSDPMSCKSDLRDSEWLATLARYGLVRPSFVPDARLERLRQLTRTHTRLRDVATKLKGQVHRLLDEGGLRIGGILTDVLAASGRHMLEGLVRGDSVEALLEGVKGKARAKLDRLRAALQEGLDAQTREMLDMQYRLWSHVQGRVLDQEMRVLEAAKRDYRTAWRQLQTLPGCGPLAAAAVLAEIGPEMERFGSARRLASWAGVCPGNRESAGKRGSGRTRKGSRYLRRILCEIVHPERAVRPAQEGPGRAPRRRSCRGGGGPQDPAHHLRDAARRGALRGSGNRLQRLGREAQRPALAACPSRRGSARAGAAAPLRALRAIPARGRRIAGGQARRLAHRARTREGLPAPATAALGPPIIARSRRTAPGSPAVRRRIA